VIGLLADCLSAWLIFRLARTAFRDDVPAILLSVAWVIHPFRLSIAGGGMEAPLVTVFLLLSFERLVIRRALVEGAVGSTLAVLTRPDAVIALGPMFAYLLWRDRPYALKASALAAGLALPWILWATSTFGSAVPNSLVAKTAAYQFSPLVGIYFILPFLATGTIGQFTITPLLVAGSILVGTVLAFGIFQTARHDPRFVPLVIYAPLFIVVMALANAPMFFPWYYYPILPSLLFTIAAFAWFFPVPSLGTRRVVVVVILTAALVVPAWLITFAPSWPLSRERESAYFDACQFLQKSASAGEVILAPDIGVLGWCLPQMEILDPIGLVSPRLMYLGRLPEVGHPDRLVVAAGPGPSSPGQYGSFTTPLTGFTRACHIVWSTRLHRRRPRSWCKV
jgi:hypothetical protein